MSAEVYDSKPEDFLAAVEIAACYLEIDGHLLLLKCGEQKPEAGCWGVPAGKLEKGETPLDAAIRELFEETGIRAERVSCFSLGSLFIRKPEIDYVYHLFKVVLDALPSVQLSEEHPSFLWASKEDLGLLPLMDGAGEALLKYRTALEE